MNNAQVIETIERGRIIAILRGDYQGRECDIASVLADAGVTAIEITLNSPGAMSTLPKLIAQFGQRMAVGAGTVLKTDEVQKVADMGGSFIVSPNRNVKVIQATKQRNLVSVPGCFTPSEIIEALDAGADAAKLFPAVSLGPAFVRSVRGPMPDVRMVPTGSVNPETGREYIKAGAWALGVGSELVSTDALKPGGMERLAARAAAFVAAIKSAS